jgi:hypothetical protein
MVLPGAASQADKVLDISKLKLVLNQFCRISSFGFVSTGDAGDGTRTCCSLICVLRAPDDVGTGASLASG